MATLAKVLINRPISNRGVLHFVSELRTVERYALNLLESLTLMLSRLDHFSDSIELFFLQFYDPLVAGSDCLLNSGSEIPYSAAEIVFVSARGALSSRGLSSLPRLRFDLAAPVMAIVSPGTRFRGRGTRQNHRYRTQQALGTKYWH
jgi:hypothetical protein